MENQIPKQDLEKIEGMIELSDYAQKLIRMGLFNRAQAVLTILQEERDELYSAHGEPL
jgi:hypothetical protein